MLFYVYLVLNSKYQNLLFFLKLHDDRKVLCRCGGIGRRDGFKIHCPQGRAGSIPVIGTI